MTLDEAIAWTKDRACDAWDRSIGAFRYLSGAPLPPTSLPEHQPVDMKKPQKKDSTRWGLVGMFSSLRSSRVGSTEIDVKRADGEMWTEGEVHADLIRVSLLFSERLASS
jgi:import inner membrane translocase subunit TIM21